LDLLILLLKSSNESINAGNDGRELLIFASEKLNTSHIDLKNQLANLHQPELYSVKEVYLNTNSLLIRALLTTSWFNSLFSDVKAVSKYETPRLDIKQGISELHFLNLLEQQLMQLPQPAEKLENWLINKSENLIAALDQSCAKALSMKPYWL
jgi:triphosphatase